MSQEPIKGYRGRPPSPELLLKMRRNWQANTGHPRCCRACEGTGQNPASVYQECKECHGTGRDDSSHQVSPAGR